MTSAADDIGSSPDRPTFRFAPSPNGRLHLGHALSALANADVARATGGRLLLRIEDIDLTRSRPEFVEGIFEDLAWLGIACESPVRRQSEHVADYRAALDRLKAMGLVYPAFLTRSDIAARVGAAEAAGAAWPRDPDGAPHAPPDDRERSEAEQRRLTDRGVPHAWRLDMRKALSMLAGPLDWTEIEAPPGDGRRQVAARPERWGDVVLWRKDAPASYHLAVTVDDALQGVTHVVRGMDLFEATAVHRLLQHLLGLPAPLYHHHPLVLAPDGRKLAKSRKDTALSALRAQGVTPEAVRRMVGR